VHKNQLGLAHLGLILVAVVVIGAIGFAGWKVANNSKAKTSTSTADTNELDAAVKAKCDKSKDKDLCRFFSSSWKESRNYKVTDTDIVGDSTITVFEADGNNYHEVVTGEHNYEEISIDQTTIYTKAGDVWYKETIDEPIQDPIVFNREHLVDPDVENPSREHKVTYNFLGKEACGTLTCFKYEVVDYYTQNGKRWIWFDDKEYQLRKSRQETTNGVGEKVFAYENISVSVPSPVKELGPDQYLPPGATKPVTSP
jgi:hypothetical protein